MRLKKSLLLILLIPIVVLSGISLAWNLKVRSDVRTLRQTVRDAHYPLTLEELAAWYIEPPSGQNAADFYLKAAEELRKPLAVQIVYGDLPLLGGAELPPPCEPLPAGMAVAVETYLGQESKTLDLLYEGARHEQARYPIELTVVPEVPLPHLFPLRACTQLLVLEAVLSAEQGRTGPAVESIVAALHLAGSLAEEPVLISQLVRINLNMSAKEALERVVGRARLDDEELARLDRAFTDAERLSPQFVRGLAGERATWASMFAMRASEVIKLGDRPKGAPPPTEGFRLDAFQAVTGAQEYAQRWYLQRMGELMDIARKPVEEQPDRVEAMLRTAQQASEANYAKPIFIALPRSLLSYGRDVATLRAARTALAIERYRLRHGQLPQRLDDLVPDYFNAVPTDPFSGRSLGFRLRDAGYIVYSVSLNRRDDGGIDINEGKHRGLDKMETDAGFVMCR